MTLRSIISLFTLPSIPKCTDEEERALLNKAVKKHSSGSILLQYGSFLLTSDVADLKKKALKHKN